MYLYYTVPSNEDDIQDKPQLSLGGFRSGSKVANGVFNNLFSDITSLTINNFNQNKFIALVLKNDSGNDANNIKVWFNFPDLCYSKLRIAAVDMVLDSSGKYQMEHVPEINSMPLNAEFYECNGEINAVDLGSLQVGEMLGIWIEFSLLLDIIKEDQDNIYEKDPAKDYIFREVIKGKFDDIGLGISWD